MVQEVTGIYVGETTAILGGSDGAKVGALSALWSLLKPCHFQGEDLDGKLWLILVSFSSQTVAATPRSPHPCPSHMASSCAGFPGAACTHPLEARGRHNRPCPPNVRGLLRSLYRKDSQ